MRIRAYADSDLDAVLSVWNEVVEEGIAFPQEEPLTPETGREFFAAQSYTGVAEDEDGQVVGIYILHPNNVGRCGHIANASYAVRRPAGGVTSGKSWSPTAWQKPGKSASACCSSMRSWKATGGAASL